MVTNYGGIHNWLRVTGAMDDNTASRIKSLAYQAGRALDPTINGYYKVRLLRALGLRPRPSVPTKPNSAAGTRRSTPARK